MSSPCPALPSDVQARCPLWPHSRVMHTPGGAFRLGDDGQLDIMVALVWAAVQSRGRTRAISNSFLLKGEVGEDVLGSQKIPRDWG